MDPKPWGIHDCKRDPELSAFPGNWGPKKGRQLPGVLNKSVAKRTQGGSGGSPLPWAAGMTLPVLPRWGYRSSAAQQVRGSRSQRLEEMGLHGGRVPAAWDLGTPRKHPTNRASERPAKLEPAGDTPHRLYNALLRPTAPGVTPQPAGHEGTPKGDPPTSAWRFLETLVGGAGARWLLSLCLSLPLSLSMCLSLCLSLSLALSVSPTTTLSFLPSGRGTNTKY